MNSNNTRKASKDNTQDNLQILKQLFPSAFTADGELDVNILKQLVGTDDEANQGVAEKFGLTWAGKSKVFGTVRQTTNKTLKPNRQNSVDFDKTKHLFIEGDNLDALKILERSYFNKVKMIYIDPPYNTGNDFVYNDDFKTSQAEHEQVAGTHDELGQTKRSDGLTKNSKDKGRYHSNWLNMMYPRLHIARNLLKDDGVIFVSIDDNEVHHLRMIMDEIFGEENFVAEMIWEKKYTTSNNIKGISNTHEYILCFCKSIDSIDKSIGRLSYTDKALSRFKNPDNDPRGPWSDASYHGPKSPTERKNLNYPLTHPKTGVEIWPKEKSWAYEKSNYEKHVAENRLYWGKNNSYKEPRVKIFLSEIQGGVIPRSLLSYKDSGSTSEGRADLRNIFGLNEDGALFDNPKPVKLLSKLLSIGASNENNDIILDFYAGSGTTAHAVMQLNAEDGGNRKYICVQLPEVTDEKSEAFKAGYKTIADIARERIRRAGKKIMADNADKLKNRKTPLDIGFKDFAVAPSNFVELPIDATDQTQLLLVNNLKSGVKDEDLLTQMRLLQGKTLDVEPTQATFGDLTVYEQDETCFVIQPNANLADLKQLLKAKYSKIVLLDRVFKDSKDMTNFDQEYQALDSQKIIEIC